MVEISQTVCKGSWELETPPQRPAKHHDKEFVDNETVEGKGEFFYPETEDEEAPFNCRLFENRNQTEPL